jgi:hypothetical protein
MTQTNRTFKYAGIGSRSTPSDILSLMEKIGKRLGEKGWILRSGGADGADLAFERGCDMVNGKKEIFLPWKGFNGSKSTFTHPSEQAIKRVRLVHPAPDKLSSGARMLHARNVHQIEGSLLNDNVDIVICWTPKGELSGGTRTALVIAQSHQIPICNLALNRDIKEVILRIEENG